MGNRATAAKQEAPTEPGPMKITNIQKIGKLRLCAERKDKTQPMKFVDVPAGETVEVPANIWNRYKDRDDIKAMDGVQIVVGGLRPGQEMKTPNAQEMAIRLQMKQLEEKEAAIKKAEEDLHEARRKFNEEVQGL